MRGKQLRHRATIVSLIVLMLAVTVPAGAIDPFAPRGGASSGSGGKQVLGTQDLTLYGGLGTWIDMYDEEVWDDPEATILGIASRGVRTVYIETSNWHKRSDIYKPQKLGRFIEAAHAAGIYVVAWYVPGFRNLDKDERRIAAALNFTSLNGQTFDSFALDIEATVVNDLDRRSRRALKLCAWLRELVGPDFTMGAIVPDLQSTYWDGFPYAEVAGYFDVMMPMSYFTYRVHGRAAVKEYINHNFDALRELIGDPNFPVHNIGGIGGRSTRREARAYVNAVIANAGIGGSYYDYPITAEREWEELYALGSR